MAILVAKVFVVWSSLAIVTGLALGAVIQRGERSRKDVFLSSLFAAIETLQASRG